VPGCGWRLRGLSAGRGRAPAAHVPALLAAGGRLRGHRTRAWTARPLCVCSPPAAVHHRARWFCGPSSALARALRAPQRTPRAARGGAARRRQGAALGPGSPDAL